jgi:hypothetical protein
VGKTSSALRSAASQDFSAVGSAHPLSEAVLLAALTLGRLVGLNHRDTSCDLFNKINSNLQIHTLLHDKCTRYYNGFLPLLSNAFFKFTQIFCFAVARAGKI